MLARVFLCIGIGVTIAFSYWWVWLVSEGKKIGDALDGKVEDAIGKLEGVIALGVLAGGVVGLVFGPAKYDRAKANRDAGERRT